MPGTTRGTAELPQKFVIHLGALNWASRADHRSSRAKDSVKLAGR
jgi:hypothetical protein